MLAPSVTGSLAWRLPTQAAEPAARVQSPAPSLKLLCTVGRLLIRSNHMTFLRVDNFSSTKVATS